MKEKMIYRIVLLVDLKDKNSNKKFCDCKSKHPSLEGEFIYFTEFEEVLREIGEARCLFKWKNEETFMTTSKVSALYGELGDDSITIVTENSVYTFARIR